MRLYCWSANSSTVRAVHRDRGPPPDRLTACSSIRQLNRSGDAHRRGPVGGESHPTDGGRRLSKMLLSFGTKRHLSFGVGPQRRSARYGTEIIKSAWVST